jgi:hypothetical protein
MPDTDRLNRWLALVANVGILIGLALVIVQIRQSPARALDLSKPGDDVSNQVYANLLGEHGGDVIEKSVECPEELTYGEFMAFGAFLFTGINMSRAITSSRRRGSTPKRIGSRRSISTPIGSWGTGSGGRGGTRRGRPSFPRSSPPISRNS